MPGAAVHRVLEEAEGGRENGGGGEGGGRTPVWQAWMGAAPPSALPTMLLRPGAGHQVFLLLYQKVYMFSLFLY